MPVSDKTKERAIKQKSEKDFNAILREIVNSIKDTSSTEMITQAITSLETAIKDIDIQPQDSQELVQILKELKLSNNNSELLIVT